MTVQPVQAELFSRCPLPGCRAPVDDPRIPCGECAAVLGPRIRPVPATQTAAEFAAESAAGDLLVAGILADRRSGITKGGGAA